MALRKIFEVEGKSIIQTSFGVVENGTQRVSFSAYVKVMSISGDKHKITAIVRLSSDVAQCTTQYQVPVSVETGSGNFIEQVYQHLKTLPEFAGAEDC